MEKSATFFMGKLMLMHKSVTTDWIKNHCLEPERLINVIIEECFHGLKHVSGHNKYYYSIVRKTTHITDCANGLVRMAQTLTIQHIPKLGSDN